MMVMPTDPPEVYFGDEKKNDNKRYGKNEIIHVFKRELWKIIRWIVFIPGIAILIKLLFFTKN